VGEGAKRRVAAAALLGGGAQHGADYHPMVAGGNRYGSSSGGGSGGGSGGAASAAAPSAAVQDGGDDAAQDLQKGSGNAVQDGGNASFCLHADAAALHLWRHSAAQHKRKVRVLQGGVVWASARRVTSVRGECDVSARRV
jgi:hypothetical protein